MSRPSVGVQDHADRAGGIHIKHLYGFVGAAAQNYICTIIKERMMSKVLENFLICYATTCNTGWSYHATKRDYFYELTPGVVLPSSFPGFCPTRPPERDSRKGPWERGCSPSCSHYWWVRRIINTQDRGYRNGNHLLRRSRWFVGLFPVERSSPVCTCCSTDTYTQGKISSSFMIRTMKAETKIWILSLRCAFAE